MTLARANDPYIKTDGKIVDQVGLSNQNVSDASEARKVMPKFDNLVVTKEIALDNVPEPDNQEQIVIASIVGLRLLGLSVVDISDMMKVSIETVQSIVKKPATQVTFEKVYQNLIHASSENVQGRLASHANSAVDVVVEMMNDGDTRDDVRLKAAQDVLDRSGTHPDQFFSDTAQNNQADDELRIVIMDESGENEKIKVDIKKGK